MRPEILSSVTLIFVILTGCFIDVNDDCISIKSGKDEDGLRVNRPSENILVKKCRISAMKGLTVDNVRDIDYSGLNAKVSEGEVIIYKSGKVSN